MAFRLAGSLVVLHGALGSCCPSNSGVQGVGVRLLGVVFAESFATRTERSRVFFDRRT